MLCSQSLFAQFTTGDTNSTSNVIRVTGNGNRPAAGEGLEMGMVPAAYHYLLAYDYMIEQNNRIDALQKTVQAQAEQLKKLDK